SPPSAARSRAAVRRADPSTTGCARCWCARSASRSGRARGSSATPCISASAWIAARATCARSARLDLDRDAPRAALVHHPDHVMPGRLGGARDVGRALRVVEEEIDLLACRQRLETDLCPGPAERALDAPQVERVTRH